MAGRERERETNTLQRDFSDFHFIRALVRHLQIGGCVLGGTNLLGEESSGAWEPAGPGPVRLRAKPLLGKLIGGGHQLDQAVSEDRCVEGVRAQSGGGGGG